MIRITQRFIVLPLIIAVIIYTFVTFRRNGNARWKHFAIDLLFIIYSAFVIGVLYFPLTLNIDGETLMPLNINIVPIVNLIRSMFLTQIGVNMYEVLVASANIVLFIPMSAYLVIRFGDNFRRNVILALSISICAEFVQLLLIPIVGYQDHIIDIDDIILNCFGCVSSLLIFNRIRNGLNRI